MSNDRTHSETVGDKADYVRAEALGPAGDHGCHWPGCNKAVPPAMWGCKSHWMKLPRAIRTAIWKAFRPGQERTKTPSREYVEAAHAAQAWILENHPPERLLL